MGSYRPYSKSLKDGSIRAEYTKTLDWYNRLRVAGLCNGMSLGEVFFDWAELIALTLSANTLTNPFLFNTYEKINEIKDKYNDEVLKEFKALALEVKSLADDYTTDTVMDVFAEIYNAVYEDVSKSSQDTGILPDSPYFGGKAGIHKVGMIYASLMLNGSEKDKDGFILIEYKDRDMTVNTGSKVMGIAESLYRKGKEDYLTCFRANIRETYPIFAYLSYIQFMIWGIKARIFFGDVLPKDDSEAWDNNKVLISHGESFDKEWLNFI